ncbi:MAG TPA: CBS domain-containing protein [Thermoanaerobaculia bacterium]|nr:CBS domain-containing protein [Thermoanaerobaculia bacterium]
MKVHDAMTHAPAACEPTTPLRLVAQLMSDHQCAAIPITASGRLIGIVTDRDIACRAVALRDDAATLPAAACMSQPVITVAGGDSIEHAIALMEENAIHHLPVIREDGTLIGILAQSDLGRRMTNREFGALTRRTSIRSRYDRRFASALVKAEH